MDSAMQPQTGPAKASVRDTLAVIAEVLLPTLGKGIFRRRPRMVAAAERFGLDSRAVRRLQALRKRYGDGPVILAVPFRTQAVVLSPDHAAAILAGAPEPFAPATREKYSALAHFEPRVSLISTPPERGPRRAFNDDILESGQAVHAMAGLFLPMVDDAAQRMLDGDDTDLSWARFNAGWHRLVRRVVLGRQAEEDVELTDMLARLRAAANWAFLHPGKGRLLKRFRRRLREHLAHAEPGSLSERIAARPERGDAAPIDQVTHWLFAFEPAAMAAFRALALLQTHPEALERAVREANAPEARQGELPFLRACVLEALRLWPTTPTILRETTEPVTLGGGRLAKGTKLLIFAPYFHRDEAMVPNAHRFAPEHWLDGAAERRGAPPLFVPFSAGPAACPARHLVAMLTAAMIAAILRRRRLTLRHPARVDPARPLPGTLDPFSLAFGLRRIEEAQQEGGMEGPPTP